MAATHKRKARDLCGRSCVGVSRTRLKTSPRPPPHFRSVLSTLAQRKGKCCNTKDPALSYLGASIAGKGDGSEAVWMDPRSLKWVIILSNQKKEQIHATVLILMSRTGMYSPEFSGTLFSVSREVRLSPADTRGVDILRARLFPVDTLLPSRARIGREIYTFVIWKKSLGSAHSQFYKGIICPELIASQLTRDEMLPRGYKVQAVFCSQGPLGFWSNFWCSLVPCRWQECAHGRSPEGSNHKLGVGGERLFVFWGLFGLFVDILYFVFWCPLLYCLFQPRPRPMTDLSCHGRHAALSGPSQEAVVVTLCYLL